MPTNFKSYEAQSRLLAAVLASQPNLKLNFKAIADHFGSDTTPSAIKHRFRPIKKHVAALRQAVAEGKDARELAPVITMKDKEVHKYYGESTPQGLEFQFRAIKKDAKALKEAADKGLSPLSVTTASTPRKRKAASGDNGGGATPASRKRTATPSGRSAAIVLTNDEDDDSIDYDLLDVTPTNTPTKRTSASSTAASSSGPASGSTTPTPSYPLSSWAAVLQPPTTPAAAATQVPDATPALTVGATPSDRGQADDDDEVFIIDTPTKKPKIKAELPVDGTDDTDDKTWHDGFFAPQAESDTATMSFSRSMSFWDNDGAV